MEIKLAKILDKFLARIARGESIEACLAGYASLRNQIAPLLRIGRALSSMPRVSPSDEFRETAKGRLMARLRQESNRSKVVELDQSLSFLDYLDMVGQWLWQAIGGVRRVAIPVTLALIIALGASIGASNWTSPSPALASGCTLSIFSGSVEIQATEEGERHPGTDGMTLNVGTRIKTAPDSHALITFFDGSTLKLEPGTDIEIQQLVGNDEQNISIVLKQWVGKTWSRVIKMADPGSHYEIETPSACAVVRGTLFATEVDEEGETTVATTEGLVSVVAQGEEVYIPANQRTQVEAGSIPAQPFESPGPTAEIIINIDTPAIASIIDPNGASTGYLQNGLAFNQIPGSRSLLQAGGTQIITIPQPGTGEYTIALRFVKEGTAHLDIQGQSDGRVVFDYQGNYEGESEQGWLIKLNLQVDNGFIVGGHVNGVAPLTNETPEKIVKTNLASEDSFTVALLSMGKSGQEASNNSNNQSNGIDYWDNNQAQADNDKGQTNEQAQTDDEGQINEQAQADDDEGQTNEQTQADDDKDQTNEQAQADDDKGKTNEQAQADDDKGQTNEQAQADDDKGRISDQDLGYVQPKDSAQGSELWIDPGQWIDLGQWTDSEPLTGQGQNDGQDWSNSEGQGQSGSGHGQWLGIK